MSVSFDIAGYEWDTDEDGCSCPPRHMYVNLSNLNARDFLNWLGLGESLWGEMKARDLSAVLRRRLWPERRRVGDTGMVAMVAVGRRGAVLADCGRAPGRLAEHAERLLALAECAGDGVIIWT